jgi:outer membrane protein assembly factor BamA
MVALSDVLGNEGYYMFLSNDASSLGTFLDGMELGVTYFNRAQRLNYGFGAFRLTRTYDADFDVVRRERRVGVTGLAAYPISKFERIEASTVLRYAQDHYLRIGEFQDLWLMSNFLSVVRDDARFTPWGPASGARMNLTGGFTRDLSSGQGDFMSVSTDIRRYLPIAREVVWAHRVAAEASFGDDKENFYLGGYSSLRAWPRRSLSGPKVVLYQTELRFPILRGMRLGFPLPMAFPRVNATLSAELAGAGDTGERFKRLGTVGAGIYVGGGWFPVLRLDFLKRTDLEKIEPKTLTRFTLGYLF